MVSRFSGIFKKADSIYEAKNIYWYVGGSEGIKNTKVIKPMVRKNKLAVESVKSLLVSSNTKFKFEIDPQGIHRQTYFNKYFKKGLRYLKLNKKVANTTYCDDLLLIELVILLSDT